MSKKVLILAASDGSNLKLAEKIHEVIINRGGFESEVINLIEFKLPLYTNEQAKLGVSSDFQSFCIEKLAATQIMIFLAPEYNGGLPPSLTNFIAWVGTTSKGWRSHFNSKQAVIGTHSGGGGLHALMALRTQLSYIGMNVLGRQIHTHYKKELNLEALDQIIDQF